MAVKQIEFTRGGTTKIAHIGIDENGDTVLFIIDKEIDPFYQQKVKYAPIEMKIDFDQGNLNGKCVKIFTTWTKVLESNSGVPLHGHSNTEYMTTNVVDLKTFVAMFGHAILASMLNGRVRSIDGFNNYPVFNTDGTLKAITPEQEQEAPTYDYLQSDFIIEEVAA